MALEEGTAKIESTILSRSEDILKRLADFQERLDNRFSRGLKAEGKSEGRPENPNVLNEILENLEMADQRLSAMFSFISSEVLPKIN